MVFLVGIEEVNRRQRSTTRCHFLGDLFPVAVFRVVTSGYSNVVPLTKFIAAINDATDTGAMRNLLPVPLGDAAATWADTKFLKRLTGFQLQTKVKDGVADCVKSHRHPFKPSEAGSAFGNDDDVQGSRL